MMQLKRIQNSQGQWLDNEEEIAEEAVGFFQAQFHETVVPTQFDILKHVPSMISNEQNEELVAILLKKEVKRYITHTNLILLPKKKDVQTFSDMRPISLSNFVNKVFSRVVHERMVHLLRLISRNQARFVRGRSIVENILLTQEIINDIRLRTNKGKKNANAIVPNVVMKLDMTKAYDRGVKQGDPLSPTLFILAVEVLSRGLNALHNNLWFTGFGVRCLLHELIAKVRNRLQVWKGKLLSFGGRAILLKHVLQAMPMHLLSAVDPPSFVIKKLHKIFAQFFWSNAIGERSRHWTGWDLLLAL
ncbi:uncharacterized protein LOC132053996 [Lycium ferocissimum]|uniref:uncharacterized protein LOC132053996 n=1 Tax=Lycium ferocissimum TaxID=112874 RepID=UPI002815B2A8|nr:uncharacterized protein LOC132053996 [Lycium ferocissimum]